MRRLEQLKFRANAEEKAQIVARAEQMGISLQDYLLGTALGTINQAVGTTSNTLLASNTAIGTKKGEGRY